MEGKPEIAAIPNKYKDTFDDFIDSLDTKSPDQLESLDRPEPIDKGTRNTPKSRGALPSFSKKDCLDKDVLVTALERLPKT